jgi:hypothetical protein
MNRVSAAIERAKARIKDRLEAGVITEERVAELNKGLDMDFAEFARFQELKSVAMLEGRKGGLTYDEAQTIYWLLGETPDHFNRQPVEVKSVLTQIFGELLEKSVGRRKRA